MNPRQSHAIMFVTGVVCSLCIVATCSSESSVPTPASATAQTSTGTAVGPKPKPAPPPTRPSSALPSPPSSTIPSLPYPTLPSSGTDPGMGSCRHWKVQAVPAADLSTSEYGSAWPMDLGIKEPFATVMDGKVAYILARWCER